MISKALFSASPMLPNLRWRCGTCWLRGNSPTEHPLDLLTAFRSDVTKRRYASWDELMRYCRYSAMPVGRFVLDLHGEDRSTWAHSDPLCAALQVINHLQDCAKDYQALDRVYLPFDIMAAQGTTVESLGFPKAEPGLRNCLTIVAGKTAELLPEAAKLPQAVKDTRLSLETGQSSDLPINCSPC